MIKPIPPEEVADFEKKKAVAKKHQAPPRPRIRRSSFVDGGYDGVEFPPHVIDNALNKWNPKN